jgi:hypothetical protein
MTNDDKQEVVPFSPQENVSELEEQALEEVTGGGRITNFLKGLKGCTACSAHNVAEDAEPADKVLTVKGSGRRAMSQAQELASRLQAASGIGHSAVQQGGKTYVVSPARV